MQWKIQFGGKDRLISLPDTIPDNTPFDASIDGRAVQLKWQRATRALFIQDSLKSDAWTSINLRSRTVTKFPGESDFAVNTEFLPAGAKHTVILDATASLFVPGQEARSGSAAKKPKVVRSQITGKVLKVLVKQGDQVNTGDTLMIIEAMKMENRVLAANGGTVDTVKVKEGESVSSGAELVRFKQQ